MPFRTTSRNDHQAITDALSCQALRLAEKSQIPVLVGGGYAMGRYTEIIRCTKDLDLFVRQKDCQRLLQAFGKEGYQTEWTHPHWLGKILIGEYSVDVIFGSGNGVAEVDDEWFEHAVPDKVLGRDVRLCPVEEIIWSKGYVMERERYDGADIAHLLRARAEHLDWQRLLRRFGPHWRVLLSHLILFGFIYPGERGRVPGWVMQDLLNRLAAENADPPANRPLCQGTLLSREQYLEDIEEKGYQDARLPPFGTMTKEAIADWTASIKK